ncbi:hypothetical protein ACKUV4_000005 [Acinetobacter baumannii]
MDLQWRGVEARHEIVLFLLSKAIDENWGDIEAVTMLFLLVLQQDLSPALVVATYQLGQTTLFAVRAGVGLANFARTWRNNKWNDVIGRSCWKDWHASYAIGCSWWHIVDV